jgi:hypothetical protein
MSFDEQPDGDIHGDEKLLVDITMKMTVHAAHCDAMLVAALEGIEVPSVDFWIGRQPAEIRALTSAICTKAKMANELEQQIDACLPYLKEGETPAECLARNRMDIDRLMGFLATEKRRAVQSKGMEGTARDALQKDARRYRWLRQKSTVISWLDAESSFARLECEQLDAAIDRARAAQEAE